MTDEEKRVLGSISVLDFQRINAWEWTGKYDALGDKLLVPAQLAEGCNIAATVGEVWCLCHCRFANGAEQLCSAMCRGDSGDGPLAWSVWNGTKFIPLFVPPALPAVIEKVGPANFSREFSLDINDVFPLIIDVVPVFITAPHSRRAILKAAP